jgi:hypothetical protein
MWLHSVAQKSHLQTTRVLCKPRSETIPVIRGGLESNRRSSATIVFKTAVNYMEVSREWYGKLEVYRLGPRLQLRPRVETIAGCRYLSIIEALHG